ALEHAAARGDPVQVRGAQHLVAAEARMVGAVLVGHDEEEVRSVAHAADSTRVYRRATTHEELADMRPKVPRLRAIPPEEWSDEAKDALGPVGGPGAAFPALNIFRTLANYPKLAKRWMVFANHVLGKNSLPAREREILILRIGWLCRAEY